MSPNVRQDLVGYWRFFTFLARVDHRGAQRMMGVAELAWVFASDAIVSAGDAGSAMYILVRGEMSVEIHRDGAVFEAMRLGPGAIFGEAVVAAGRCQPATIRALVPCQVLRFPGAVAARIIAEHPRLKVFLARIADQREHDQWGVDRCSPRGDAEHSRVFHVDPGPSGSGSFTRLALEFAETEPTADASDSETEPSDR